MYRNGGDTKADGFCIRCLRGQGAVPQPVDSSYIAGDSLVDMRDGQKYKTVTIGTQTWMAQNLNVGTYAVSVATSYIHSDVTNNGIIEKYAYNNDTKNFAMYGGLYDWSEAMGYSTTEGVRGVCPKGWHLPTDGEWKTLEMYLGMTQAQADALGSRGTNQGTQLKADGSSGFQALRSGCRSYNGSFIAQGSNAYFWSSSQYSATRAWGRYLLNSSTGVNRSDDYSAGGLCARCVKD
jgi:uncharacterized protein (TIGR02145 family)